LTKGIFFEQTSADKSSVVYTLKDEEHLGFPSLRLLYLSEGDPTEYRFAIAYLDGWDHWASLCECTWFKPYHRAWRTELELKIKSAAVARIMGEAKTASKNSFMANRYLVERAWEAKGESRAGRPTKAAVREAAHEQASESLRIAQDFERLSKN
jgi:hypothetical protein